MATESRHVAKVGKHNEVTIPPEVLQELDIRPGQMVEIVQSNGSVVLRKPESAVDRAYGILQDPNRKPMTDEELEAAIREAKDERARRYFSDDERIKNQGH